MQGFRRRTVALKGIAVVIAAAAIGAMGGCGLIADRGRVVVATLDGKNITRDTLDNLIYDMPDNERPHIRTRQDYLRVLNQYIESQIKLPLGQELADKGVIKIDREMAREQYFKSSGSEEQQRRHMWSLETPKPGEEDALMKEYNITAADVKATKDIIEQGTDQIVEKLQGEEAVNYLAAKDFKDKKIVLDEERLKTEYELTKENFKTLESLTILGLQFPTAMPGASEEAAKVRTRLNSGESFDTILNEYLQKDMRFGIESVIENNPSLERFKGFWLQASGAAVGDVLGPTYMPDYSRMKKDASGQAVQENVPECWIVFKVLEAKPAQIMPYEEAKPFVAGPVAYAVEMEKLRDEHGVKIFGENLRDPASGVKDIFAN